MAGQLKLRRGTTSQLANFIGSEGELTYDTALKSLVLHDGVTAGGVKIPYLSDGFVPSTMLPTATESVVGASKIATTAIAQAGVNDTDIITPLKLKNSVFGIGQTVQDVTASRALGTTYTNSTGKPILISVTVAGANDNKTTTLTVDGVAAASVINSKQYGQAKNICYVIPPSSTYSVVGSPISLWTELR